MEKYKRGVLRWNVSLSVCGSNNNADTVPSHVAKTGDIKDFVIIEESGIAKGIRRIIAVTGNEANEVSRIASDFKTRLDLLDSMTGKEKDAGMKALGVVSNFFWLYVSSQTDVIV